jgi:hypothetical protein
MPNDDISIRFDIQRMEREWREAKANGDVPRCKTLRAMIAERVKTYNKLMAKRKGLTR